MKWSYSCTTPEKQRSLVAGVKLFVETFNLSLTNVDDVPRDLYDEHGAAHRTAKYYLCQDIKGTSYSTVQAVNIKLMITVGLAQISTQQPTTATTDNTQLIQPKKFPKFSNPAYEKISIVAKNRLLQISGELISEEVSYHR